MELALAEVLSAIRLEKGPEEPHSLAGRVRTGGADPIPGPASLPTAPAAPSPFVPAAGSEPFRAAWISRAGEVTVRRLEDDVEHVLATGSFDPVLLPEMPHVADPTDPTGGTPDRSASPEGVQISARPTHGESDIWSANVPTDLAHLFRACLASVARRLEAGHGAALEAMFDHAIASWWVSTPRKYRVFERDGWRCTVPGCTSQRNLHAHHQRRVHGGVIRISGRAPDRLCSRCRSAASAPEIGRPARYERSRERTSRPCGPRRRPCQ